jgi:hypothetical protein
MTEREIEGDERAAAAGEMDTGRVLALSIPVALIPGTGPALAKYFWLLLVPARLAFRWLDRRS